MFRDLPRTRCVLLAGAWVALALSAGCGGGGGGGGTSIREIVVSIPSGSRLQADTRFVLGAVAVYSNGARVEISPTWEASGGIGTIGIDGAMQTSDTPADGTIVATYGTQSAVVAVSVVAPGPLSDLRVQAGEGADTAAISLSARPRFYLTASDGSSRVYVAPDPGSWRCTPSAMGTLDGDGVLTPASDGQASISAKHGGVDAVPTSVRIIAPKVSVRGTCRSADVGAPVPGVVVVFWNAAGVEVGRATSGPDGRWSAVISTTATHMFLESVPSGYYRNWRYGSGVYDINFGPDACKAPVDAPTQGKDYGTIYVYPTSGGPPPPPTC
ncbi:MAG: hypothetical protein AMXMBFR61_01090 [Fimbriimonadales bacterium]